ncbi:MAG: 4Fe-4S dicluster domain-containing protein [Planctomycetes bacterium]|nr:4Fe-4S dicluster domain-containing protein [Planctomycetota bacterium]
MTPSNPIRPEAAEAILRYEKSLDCIHCGLCLSVCPTYEVTSDEAASPRGRIYLMRGLAEGRLELTESFQEKMDLCLVCRACESICPSAVQFSRMMEVTRHEIHERGFGSKLARGVRRFFLRRIVPSRRGLDFVAALSRFYRQSGAAFLVRELRLNRLLPRGLRAMEANLPIVPPAHERRPLPRVTPPAPAVPVRGRVGFLEGCVMPALFGDLNRKAVSALAAQGYEVVVPAAQTCCGALHAHAGDMDSARQLARQNLAAFGEVSVDHVVFNSAGCGAAVADYALWFEGTPEHASAAADLSSRVVDILEFFHREGLTPRGRDGGSRLRVTYDAPCHLHHAQKVTDSPYAVLSRTPGIELVALPGAADCCGAAGIYNITQPDMSAQILELKLDALESTGAEILLTGNPGCLMQWRKGIAARGLPVRVMHPLEFL